jgi:hypothetical protein
MIKSKMKWAGHEALMRERRGVYRILVGIPEGQRPLGRLKCKQKDNIKMGLQEVGWGGGMDWIDLAHDRNRRQAPVKMVMNLQVPYYTRNFLTG